MGAKTLCPTPAPEVVIQLGLSMWMAVVHLDRQARAQALPLSQTFPSDTLIH